MNDRMNVRGGRTRRGLRRLALLFLAVMMTLSFAMTSAAAYDDINAPRNSAGPGTSGWVANADGQRLEPTGICLMQKAIC